MKPAPEIKSGHKARIRLLTLSRLALQLRTLRSLRSLQVLNCEDSFLVSNLYMKKSFISYYNSNSAI